MFFKKDSPLLGLLIGLFNPAVFIRIVWVLTLVSYGFGLIAYLFCCLLIPRKSK